MYTFYSNPLVWSKSICTCLYSFSVLTEQRFKSIQGTIFFPHYLNVLSTSFQWIWMVAHNVSHVRYMKQRTKLFFLYKHSNEDVRIYQSFTASSPICMVLHSHSRPWIQSHHTTELRIRPGKSGNPPRHMHTQKKPFGISMKNRPSKKTSSIQMSPQISRESMTTSAEVADEETHTYTPLPPIVLLGHSSN